MSAPVVGRRVAVVGRGAGALAVVHALRCVHDEVAAFDPDPRAAAAARVAAARAGVADRVTVEVAGRLLGHDYDLVCGL